MAMAGICLGVAAIVSIGMVTRSVLASLTDSFDRITGKPSCRSPAHSPVFPIRLSRKSRKCRASNMRYR